MNDLSSTTLVSSMSVEWHTEVFSSIHQVPYESWPLDERLPFHQTRDFLTLLSEAKVEQAAYRYLQIKKGNHTVGYAVLSRFLLHLDLLAGWPLLTRVKQTFPRFLCLPMICCGIPASFGQLSIHVSDPSHLSYFIKEVHRQMQRWARETETGLLVWKEFPANHPGIPKVKEMGYTVLPTLPDYQMSTLPSDLDTFMASLRSPYRRKYRQVLPLLVDGTCAEHPGLSFSKSRYGPSHAHSFYQGYHSLMKRTPVKLEQYGPEFFDLLCLVKDCHLSLLSLSSGLERVDLLVADGEEDRYLMLVSKHRARYEENLYEKLLHLLVLDTIEEGKRKLYLGQTSGYAKSVLGANAIRLETAIRFEKPWRNNLFARYGKFLFPERQEQVHRVFRPQTHEIHYD